MIGQRFSVSARDVIADYVGATVRDLLLLPSVSDLTRVSLFIPRRVVNQRGKSLKLERLSGVINFCREKFPTGRRVTYSAED